MKAIKPESGKRFPRIPLRCILATLLIEAKLPLPH
jgi:hypothetical protein